ncbi:MAG TPA: VWA domain-containing protein, partial [Pyrinomonadaceae bacterium]|nr:VWA domain-containing protein [Pyrinomonadaceae bacterium]
PRSGGDGARERPGETTATKSPSARRRTVLFFVDDLHLAPDSLMRARKALLDFIDRGMGGNDEVAVTSSSGQIGFLQQFTANRMVLQAAVARLNYRATAKLDMGNPPMSEYMALKIQEGDERAVSYYVAEILKQNCFKSSGGGSTCMTNPQTARQMVLQRARGITTMTAPDTANTLEMLAGMMRTVAQMPGRKLMFLISDGFYLNDRQTGSRDRIKRITDAAGRAGVVIYTLDARGLITEALDSTNNIPMDAEGLTRGASIGDVAASQDGLNALALDTGGLALRNTNRPMADWLQDVLDDNSSYYLLAWRPDSEEQKRGKFKDLKVTIKGRPDLSVRLRRGYFRTSALPMLSLKKKTDKDTTAREDDMRLVIDAPIEQRDIKTALSLNVIQIPGIGSKVLASLEIDRHALAFDTLEGKEAADIDIGAIFYDDKGKPKSSFVGRLRILAGAADSPEANAPAIYRFQAWLRPGLYQVRVGLRDTRSGKTGSIEHWIRIPQM